MERIEELAYLSYLQQLSQVELAKPPQLYTLNYLASSSVDGSLIWDGGLA